VQTQRIRPGRDTDPDVAIAQQHSLEETRCRPLPNEAMLPGDLNSIQNPLRRRSGQILESRRRRDGPEKGSSRNTQRRKARLKRCPKACCDRSAHVIFLNGLGPGDSPHGWFRSFRRL
jgi:hypothetical protein